MGRILVTDAMIAAEFRLQHCPGSAMNAITNPAVRRALELGAKVRAARAAQQHPTHRDAKQRAANDTD
jgi:hypothetical protein